MQLYLAAAPRYLPEAGRWSLPMAHAAYTVDDGGRLAALPLPPDLRGGLLLLVGPDSPSLPQADALCRDILRECLRRRYTGVAVGTMLPPAALSALAALCSRYGRTLYVPERSGGAAPQACAVVSTALSGGTLRRRMEETVQRFGPRRVALDLACTRMDFALPAPYGEGASLTAQQLL